MGMGIRRGSQALALALLFSLPSNAQDDPPTIEQRLSDPVYVSWAAQAEVAECIRCHYSGPNLLEVIGQQQNTGLNQFSRRQELEFWLTNDKHTIA